MSTDVPQSVAASQHVFTLSIFAWVYIEKCTNTTEDFVCGCKAFQLTSEEVVDCVLVVVIYTANGIMIMSQ